MKQITVSLLILPMATLVMALALMAGPRTGMGGTTSFNVIFAALWTFVFVWGAGLQALPFRDSLLWGAAYGFLGWLVGPVTLGGIASGRGVLWDVAQFSELFPDLIAYLFYGIALGAMYPFVYRLYVMRQPLGRMDGIGSAAVRGALAGIIIGLVFGTRLPSLGLLPVPGMHPENTPGLVYLLLSMVVGAILGVVTAQAEESEGAGLIRGMVHGLLWWVIFVLTLQPLISGERVAWTLDAAQARNSQWLGLMIYGGLLALVYHLLTRLQASLFSDGVGLNGQDEGIGARNLRALVWGGAGSILGGLVFTVVMVQTGALPTIAGIIRGADSFTGLVVHFVISILIGSMYGLLYRGQARSYGDAIGWGTAYGLFWWLLGPITLLPLLLGREGTLTTGPALAAFPASFIGHVVYGVVTAMYFYALEQRHAAQESAMAAPEPARVNLAQSPMWVLVALFVATVPVLLHL